MGKINKRILLFVSLFIVVLILLFFVIRAKKRLASAPVYNIRPVPVKVIKLKKQNISLTIHYLARLESDLTSLIRPKITAQIIENYKDEGDYVKKGDLLCKLYDKDILDKINEINSQINSMKSKINATKAELLGAKSEYEYIKKEYIRTKKLYEGNATSRSSLDAIIAQYEINKQRVANIKQTIRSLESSLKGLYAILSQTKVLLSYTEIRAPYNGIISERLQDVGDMANPATPIYKMYSPQKAKLTFSVVQEDIGKVKPGMEIKIDWPKKKKNLPKTAKITKIYPSLISGKSTIAESYLGEIPTNIKIGSFIPIDVVIKRAKGLCVPTSAIVSTKGSKAIYVVKKSRLILKKVRIKLMTPEYTIIYGDVDVGDMVVVGDYLKWTELAPGMKVEAFL